MHTLAVVGGIKAFNVVQEPDAPSSWVGQVLSSLWFWVTSFPHTQPKDRKGKVSLGGNKTLTS